MNYGKLLDEVRVTQHRIANAYYKFAAQLPDYGPDATNYQRKKLAQFRRLDVKLDRRIRRRFIAKQAAI